MKKTVCFVTPTYNASFHLEECYESLKEQTNPNWKWVILNDMSSDDTLKIANNIASSDERERVTVVNHVCKKFALKGIYDYLNNYAGFSEQIIAILDGDDALCNENTVDLIIREYNDNPKLDALWTAHSWDINGMNISRELPGNLNPYQYPWVSSHLKTWRASLLKSVNDTNFKNLDGEWFKRGYDQALYLPLIFKSRETKFLDEICYLYRINSKSVDVRVWSDKDQMDTVRLVRARGFIS